MSTHARAERRSIELHRAVAALLRGNASILDRARERVDGWQRSGAVHAWYVHAWSEILSGSAADVAAFLVDTGEHARTLRQVSPFAGVLDARTRWRILREATV